MSNIIDDQYSPEIRRKTKLSLLWLGIFSIMMLFGGLTSGYIVSSGDLFWVDFKLPQAFVYSTVCLLLSSAVLFGGQVLIKNGNKKGFKGAMAITLILGLLFGWFQFKGWEEMVDDGYVLGGGNPIVNVEGRYGQYFSLTYEGKELNFDGSKFIYKGESISEELNSELLEFAREIRDGLAPNSKGINSINYGSTWLIYNRGNVLTLLDNKFQVNGKQLSIIQRGRLQRFMDDRANARGDFSMKGIYGEDFFVLYRGEALGYENREFSYNGQLLSAPLMNKLYGAENTSSSYVYAFTVVHLLHWVGGIIALLVLFIKGMREKYTVQDNLGVVIGARYWHFLGILWLYLYLFLIIIH